jgi:protein required for attachment to host cells
MRHWVVITDAGSCRVYETNDALSAFAEVRSLTNERIHLEVAELVSDQRGATQSRPGGERSAFDRHTDPREVERVRFAREVAELLEQEAPERIVIAAPPRFLGDLRAQLSERVHRAVLATIEHDYVKTPLNELPERIRAHLSEAEG